MKTLLLIGLAGLLSLQLSAQLTEQEPNDNFAQANPLPDNITMSGVTCQFPETDFFRIILPMDGTLRIITSISANTPAPGNLYFTLYSKTQGYFGDQAPRVGANGNPLADTLYWTCLSADTFYVAVHCQAIGFAYCFNYLFSYTVLPPVFGNDIEPNDNFAQAEPLAYNTNLQGHLGFYEGQQSFVDFFRIITPQDGVIRLIIQAESPETFATKFNITLFDKHQGYYGDRYPDVGANHSVLTDTVYWHCIGGDTAYLKLFINNTVDCGITYSIKYDVLPTVFTNDTEPNDNFAQAEPLAYNTNLEGHLGFYDAGQESFVDYFRIITPQDGQVMVIISAESAEVYATKLNLTLFDKHQGYYGDRYPDVGANHTALTDTLYWTCIGGDTAYLKLFINNTVDCGITYKIRYQILPPAFGNDTEPNDNFAQATHVPLNTNVDGHLGFYDAGQESFHDYYMIVLPAPADLKVYASAEGVAFGYPQLPLTWYDHTGHYLGDKYVDVGSFSVPTKDTFNYGCVTADTFYFHIYINAAGDCGNSYRLQFATNNISLNLGNDTTICGPINLTLNAGSGFSSYAWNTGATGSSINVIDTGSYSVTVTSACSGSLSDTIHIGRTNNAAQLKLPNDTTICSGNIDMPLSVPAGFSNIHWSTGSTAQQITVTAPGTYWVNAQSSCGTSSDTIHISAGSIQTTGPAIQNFVINTGDSLLLTSCATGKTYLWDSPGLLNCDTCQTILVAPAGSTQYISLITDNGCQATCKYNITVASLPDGILLPSAFTPNNDGLNDIFRIIHGSNVQLNYFRIYDRWGQLVFSTTDISKGWNGTVNGQKQVAGIYAWVLSAKDTRTGKDVFKKGTVLLVR